MKSEDDLDFNQKNLEETNKIMEKATSRKSDEWDRNNPIIKFILGFLLLFIVIGSIIIFIKYFS